MLCQSLEHTLMTKVKLCNVFWPLHQRPKYLLRCTSNSSNGANLAESLKSLKRAGKYSKKDPITIN